MSEGRRDSLDDLLAQARWPKPTAESRQRLDAAWDEITRSRLRMWSTIAATAAAALVIGVGVWTSMQRPHASAPIAKVIDPPMSEPAYVTLVVGREPTFRERAMLRMAEREAAMTKHVKEPSPVVNEPPAADARDQGSKVAKMLESPRTIEAYLELVADRTTRDEALAALHQTKKVRVDALFAHLQSPRADLRVAAAEALGELNGPVITRRLITMIRADQNKREAYLALASSRGREAQEFVKQAAESDALANWAQSAIRQTAIH